MLKLILWLYSCVKVTINLEMEAFLKNDMNVISHHASDVHVISKDQSTTGWAARGYIKQRARLPASFFFGLHEAKVQKRR